VLLTDVNVLIYAFSERAEDHHAYRDWLERMVMSDQAYGLSDLVLSGFVRVVTNPRFISPASTVEDAFRFTDHLRGQPNAVPIRPGPRHWQIFTRLCRDCDARANLVADAYHAALAIESGSEWITTDRDYGRFSGLSWRHPLRQPDA
jgi:uncharacterized protein